MAQRDAEEIRPSISPEHWLLKANSEYELHQDTIHSQLTHHVGSLMEYTFAQRSGPTGVVTSITKIEAKV